MDYKLRIVIEKVEVKSRACAFFTKVWLNCCCDLGKNSFLIFSN